MKPILFLALIPMVCLLLAGCSTGAGSPEGKAASAESLAALENVDLNCVRLVAHGKTVALPADSGITLRIAEPGKVTGRAAVNRYFGSYTLDGPGQAQWTPFGATRMAGPPERMTLENDYLTALAGTTRVVTTANGLTFRSADGADVVEFTR